VSLAATLGDGPYPRTGGNLKSSNDIRGVISLSGPYDLEKLSWGTLWKPAAGEPKEARRLASPIRYVSAKTRPILILHSDNDGSVPVQQATEMADALKKAKAPYRLSIHKKKGHMRITEDVIKETRTFIEAVSKSGLPPAGEDKQPKFVLAWGKKGDKPGEFHSPIGIAINKKDEIFVTDLNNARLQKFDTDGKYLGGFDMPPDNPKRKSSLNGGIAVDDQGLIYLSFMGQHKIGVYTESGKLVREWGKRGKADGELDTPGGIVLAGDGTFYVADQGNNRIQRFTTDGKFLAKWGEHGPKPGQFDGLERPGNRFGGPHLLARDSLGRIYSTEGVLGRVQQFSPEGKPLAAWGDKRNVPGSFGSLQTGYSKHSFGPIAIVADKHDRIWVSSLNDRVQLFTPDGKYLLGIGGSGEGPGQFARPHGMAFDSKCNLYVADAGNERIQKFAIPEP
jgi:sugar lactone lactonase YvrE